MTTTTDGGDATAKQRAQQTASTAKDEGQHVAGVAKEQATQVASEAAAQAKNVASDALTQVSGQLREQGSAQRDKLVTTLSALGDDLASMADRGSPGLATDLTRQAADQARSLTSRLDGREPGEILEDLRGFARQRPGVFLLGSLAAGVVAGRLLAGARDGIAAAEAAPNVPSQGLADPSSGPASDDVSGSPTPVAAPYLDPTLSGTGEGSTGGGLP